jgi:hypothetical protein
MPLPTTIGADEATAAALDGAGLSSSSSSSSSLAEVGKRFSGKHGRMGGDALRERRERPRQFQRQWRTNSKAAMEAKSVTSWTVKGRGALYHT